MGFLKNLFGEKNNHTDSPSEKPKSSSVELAAAAINATNQELNNLAAQKDARPAVTEQELTEYFVEYFAANSDFFSQPGSEKSNAYFGAVNAARDEMLNNPDIFKMATKWEVSKLKEMIENPQPVLTNMYICGLIFRTGEYAVLPSRLLCVDFCDSIPHCIALYLLLTAQKLPDDKRKQIIDAGDRSDKTAFKNAMDSLRILDPAWDYMIA